MSFATRFLASINCRRFAGVGGSIGDHPIASIDIRTIARETFSIVTGILSIISIGDPDGNGDGVAWGRSDRTDTIFWTNGMIIRGELKQRRWKVDNILARYNRSVQ